MTDKEKAADLLPKKSTAKKTKPKASSENTTNTNIDASPSKTKGETKTKTKKSKKKSQSTKGATPLAMKQQASSFSFKFYEEQVPGGEPKLKEAVRLLDMAKVHAFLIAHDKDDFFEDFWGKSNEKKHYHLIVLSVGRDANNKTTRYRTEQVLNWLGIVYREGVDDGILANHGAETVCDKEGSVVYLTHETPAAERDLKHKYNHEELVSNIPEELIKELYRDPYFRRVDNTVKADAKEAFKWAEEARKAGFDKMPIDDFLDTVPVSVRTQSGVNRVIREEYQRGMQLRMTKETSLLRTCIFIEGPPDVGKTYAAKKFMLDRGKKFISIGPEGGTGKYDDLTPTHDALIYDDTALKNVIQITDNYVMKVHRRGSNDPYWAGEYVIVTSNYDIRTWLRRCHVYDEISQDAVISRFFTFRLIVNGDDVIAERIDISDRGLTAETNERKKRVLEFMEPYLNTIRFYLQDKNNREDAIDFDAEFNKFNGMASTTNKENVSNTKTTEEPVVAVDDTTTDDDSLPFSSPEDKFKWPF